MIRPLLAVVTFALLSFSTLSPDNSPSLINLTWAQSSCNARENLSETAQAFISRCRSGGINREFPSEMYDKTLKEIQDENSAAHKKAWKLLNDNRFKK